MKEIEIYSLLAVAVLFPLYLLSRWLSSRGHFMLYEGVVKNSDDVGQAWRDFRELGNNLFKFRIGWDLMLFNVWLAVLIVAGALLWPDVKPVLLEAKDFVWTGWSTAAVLVCFIGSLLAGLFMWVMTSFLFGMVVPVMYVRGMKAWPAFKMVWRELFWPNFWKCILYFLMAGLGQWVGGMLAGTILFVMAIVTCLVAYVIVLLPFVGNYPMGLAMLPGMTFVAAYQLRFMAQFGPEYRVNWVVTPRGGFEVILNPGAGGGDRGESEALDLGEGMMA